MKKNLFQLMIAVLLSFNLSSCDSFCIKKDHQMTIYVATDLHLYSSNLIGKDNQTYTKDVLTTDGRVQQYDYELVNALIDTVNSNDVDYLLLTGDLSFNGEKDSHLELVKLLDKIESNCKVLVIPGNHDYNILNSISLIDDKVSSTSTITMEEFKEIYKNYGYENAYSYDEESLSYIYELSEDKWALMVDTTLSEFNQEVDFNVVGGELSANTLSWIESNLKHAKENNIEVIASSHHNLITHNELFESNYSLYNASALKELYAKYDVKLNFSGHLHIQNIQKETINEKDIYDVSMVSILDYGNRYGILDIYENCYDFKTYNLNPKMDFDFKEYSFNWFYEKYYNKQKTLNSLYYKDYDYEAITDFASKINTYYFDGNYKEISKLVKKNQDYVNIIKDKKKDKYIISIMEVNGKEKHTEILIKK